MVAGPPKVKLMVFCCLVVSAYLFFVAKILAGGQAGKRGSSGLTEVQKKQSYKSFFTVTASDSHFKRYTRRFAAGCAGETFSARSGLFGGGSGLLVYHTPLRAFRPLPIAGSSCRARERKDPGVIRLTAATSRSVRNRQRFLSSSAGRKPEFISPPWETVNIREQKG